MRFRKSFKIVPGVRINLSTRGVSTTVGGRGASVNIGRRGTRTTVGLPGTGISFSQRVGGGGRASGTAGTGGGGSNEGAARAGGCMSTGCLGFFLLVLVGMCSDTERPSSQSYPTSTSSYSSPSSSTSSSGASGYGTSGYGTSAYSADPEVREWFYIHGTLNVRAEPQKDASVVRKLRHGDYVQLGPKDASGWARLYSPGSAEGYVYRESELVQRQSPGARSAASTTRASSGNSRRSSGGRAYHVGPRGGCYYYNSSGNKQYVDRSNCY